MAVVEAKGVTVRAGGATLIDDIDAAIRTGERVAIVGPNGAGKSTLLRALAGEVVPQAGVVLFKGRVVANYRPHVLARHRAVLSQSVTVAFPFTVDEIVRMGAAGAGEVLVETTLAEVDLTHARSRIITTMSGGEQHRAHLARVLVQLACGEAEHGPGLLLLDEPTASLDLRHQMDFLAVTRRRAEAGTAIVAVMHDLNLAAAFADRIVVLDGGAVAGNGTVATNLNADLLSRVFGVRLTAGMTADAIPFVLPQTIAATGRRAGMRPASNSPTGETT
jgi:iron complex transport system ATP-binding protein